MLTLETRIKRNPDLAWRVLEDRLIAVTPEDTMIHRANDTGTFLWECLGPQPRRLSLLLQALCEAFDITETRAREDLFRFIQNGIKKGVFFACPP